MLLDLEGSKSNDGMQQQSRQTFEIEGVTNGFLYAAAMCLDKLTCCCNKLRRGRSFSRSAKLDD
jgi:hypothetical protein